jgi:hypothetical protein
MRLHPDRLDVVLSGRLEIGVAKQVGRYVAWLCRQRLAASPDGGPEQGAVANQLVAVGYGS